MNCRTNCRKTLLFVFGMLALAILATPAFGAGICSTEGSGAGNCLQNESCAAGVTQKLNCTANDVRVAKVINTRNPDGTPINSCIAGQTGINFVADFLVQTTATSTRSNIGLYFADFDVTQQATALTGTCTDNVISPPHHSSDASVTTCLGSGAYADPSCTGFGTYDELDPNEPKSTTGTTGCGDSTSGDGTVCLTANDALGNAMAVQCGTAGAAQTFTATQVVTVEIKNFTCPNVTAGTQVQLPNCTSWQIPGGTIMCTTGPQDYNYPTSPPTAIEGTPSKCNCGVVSLPIIVQTPSLIVQKACEPGASASDPASPTFNPLTTPTQQAPTTCDAGAEGNTQITYTAALTNNSNTGKVTVDQICDNVYGTIYRSGSYTGAFCNGALSDPGFLGDSGTDNCAGPFDLSVSNTPTTCTFAATPKVENLGLGTTPDINDQLTVSYHGDLVTPPVEKSAQSNHVLVQSEDAPSSAKTSPGPAAVTNVCVTFEYNATVQNTGPADEKIFLTGLADQAGSLTSTSARITSTTCNSAANPFPAAGLAAGTGTPPTANGGVYNCTFDVLVCGTPTAGAERFGTGTCNLAGSPATCSAGNVGALCTKNSDCDLTCTGVSNTEQLNASLTGDDANPADVISPVVNKTTSATECVSTDQITQ